MAEIISPRFFYHWTGMTSIRSSNSFLHAQQTADMVTSGWGSRGGVLPVITNIYEAVSGLDRSGVNDSLRSAASHPEVPPAGVAAERLAQIQASRIARTQVQ